MCLDCALFYKKNLRGEDWLFDAMNLLQYTSMNGIQDTTGNCRGSECVYILCQKQKRKGYCLVIQGTCWQPVEVAAKGNFWTQNHQVLWP